MIWNPHYGMGSLFHSAWISRKFQRLNNLRHIYLIKKINNIHVTFNQKPWEIHQSIIFLNCKNEIPLIYTTISFMKTLAEKSSSFLYQLVYCYLSNLAIIWYIFLTDELIVWYNAIKSKQSIHEKWKEMFLMLIRIATTAEEIPSYQLSGGQAVWPIRFYK